MERDYVTHLLEKGAGGRHVALLLLEAREHEPQWYAARGMLEARLQCTPCGLCVPAAAGELCEHHVQLGRIPKLLHTLFQKLLLLLNIT